MPEQAKNHALERRSPDARFGASVSHSALATMLCACRSSPDGETGGILVGRYSPDLRTANVTAASTRPATSKSGRTWFVRSVTGLTEWLDQLWSARAGHYVGEWHFHPNASATPSTQDAEQMWQIARTPSYDCAVPLLVIIGGNAHAAFTVHMEVFLQSGERHALLNDGRQREAPEKRP